MPGVTDPHSLGIIREVGKMAFLNDDLDSIMPFSSPEEFADKLASDIDLLSPPPSSSSSPCRDGDSEGELLDFETPVDLLTFLEGSDALFPGLSHKTICDDDCNTNMLALKVSGQKDPFMGHRDFLGISDGPDSILGQCKHYMDESLHTHQQPVQTGFSAWGHTPSIDDDDEPALFPDSADVPSPYNDNDEDDDDDDDDDHDTLPDTPLSYSGTVTGDDSDVDIETIPDTPHSELCGYSSSDASSDLSPSISPSPFHNSNKISILQRSSSLSASTTLSSSKLIRFSSCGVSNSASLEENLMCGRSIAGKKRKHHKDKYSTGSSHSNSYSTYCPSGNSVNFHDYAMSPSSCMSTETAQPTILSSSSSSGSSKRMYKRRQLNTLDLSDKEKQNHHNQLERNRRQKLADLFIDLRDEVPSISQQSKASKVMILNEATSYIGDLQRLHRSQEDTITKELQKKEYLKKQLRQLEAHLSLK